MRHVTIGQKSEQFKYTESNNHATVALIRCHSYKIGMMDKMYVAGEKHKACVGI